ncbi:MAG: bifunctional 5,10-methylene-tetrahydrofolate dehydrogenase/5,10-methylene-tetrahydrofolate cyclohydrolase, partial [Deltaproteobacteria bacterium]|nr:bifunctional 5,10-methylene-tetrahydrofolate dehydrogenase/5,10-methylene-tetrahydrofolate cyclohydrolase [Deltaproteobacteria bacterium]
MKRLSGTEISKQIKEELKKEVISLKAQGVRPKLAVILVGDDPGSAIYVNSKKRTCAELGFGSLEKKMSAD